MLEKLLGRPLFGHEDALIPWEWFSQNLDERPGDDGDASGSKLMHGRGWLHFGRLGRRELTLHVSWDLRSRFCHANLSVDDSDKDVTFSLAAPPVAVWVGMEGLPDLIFKALGVDYETVRTLPDGVYLTARRVDVSVHNWAIWWSLWMPEGMAKSADPKWRRGSFHLLDFVFGDTRYEKKEVTRQAVLIPMPERNYRGTVTVERRTWARPRWPFRFGSLGENVLFHESLGYDLKMEEGEQIPFPGKGENSWDCGEDALFGQSGKGGIEDAIASAVRSVFKSRRRHGGSIAWKPEPASGAQA